MNNQQNLKKMEKQINEIQRILSVLDEKVQIKVLIECASKIGTKEWKDAIEDLMNRMGMK
jgi:hypothetical protein